MGNPKGSPVGRFSLDSYVKAYYAAQPYLDIEPHLDCNERQDRRREMLLTRFPTQEFLCIRKQLYEQLSKEAKYIIQCILYGPEEFVQGIFKKGSKNFCSDREKLTRFMKKKCLLNDRIIRRVLKELTAYALELSELHNALP